MKKIIHLFSHLSDFYRSKNSFYSLFYNDQMEHYCFYEEGAPPFTPQGEKESLSVKKKPSRTSFASWLDKMQPDLVLSLDGGGKKDRHFFEKLSIPFLTIEHFTYKAYKTTSHRSIYFDPLFQKKEQNNTSPNDSLYLPPWPGKLYALKQWDPKTNPSFIVYLKKWDSEFVRNVHRSLTKILITGRKCHFHWLCEDQKMLSPIKEDLKRQEISQEWISLLPFHEVETLPFSGLILNNFDHSFHQSNQLNNFLFSALNSGKIIVSMDDPYLNQYLIDGKTGFVLDEAHVTNISHIIHFLVSFPEEILRLGGEGAAYFKKEISFEALQAKVSSFLFPSNK